MLAAEDEALSTAAQALHLVQANYQAGIATYLDVLIADTQYPPGANRRSPGHRDALSGYGRLVRRTGRRLVECRAERHCHESMSSGRLPLRAPGSMSTDSATDSGIRLLNQLALDLQWSWNHASDVLWRRLDPELWSLTHNPWVILRTVSPRRLLEALADPAFSGTLERLSGAANDAAQTPWFQRMHADCGLARVAYFSMEFMLSEALPIYAGGLGNVAGDHLKAASDLGVPVVGVGLLYSQGYFRQVIARDGAQQALYPYNDPGQLPITPVRKPDGEWLRLEIGMPGHRLWLRAWQAKIGRAACICSTAMTSPITRPTAASPASSTAAAPSCGCSKRSCWPSAAGGCSTP